MQTGHLDISNKESVSVALAVYNGEKYLKELLSSLEKQTNKPTELVVLDDCSSDNSLKIIRTFPFSFEVRIFSNERNRGPVYTFKKLLDLCKGNYIAFCDQDDIWLPEKLEVSISSLKKINSSKSAVVFTDLSVIDENGKILQNSFWKQMAIKPEKFSLTDILFGNIITGCTAIINRSMASQFQKMPLDIMMHDHWIALIAYSFGKFAFIDQPTVMYRSHLNNVTSKEKSSLLKILHSDFKQRSSYLNENIRQAIRFKTIYSIDLSATDKKKLNEFISLQERPFWYRRFQRYRRSLIRNFK